MLEIFVMICYIVGLCTFDGVQKESKIRFEQALISSGIGRKNFPRLHDPKYTRKKNNFFYLFICSPINWSH